MVRHSGPAVVAVRVRGVRIVGHRIADRRGHPDRSAGGSYCDDCGRSAFGVAAIPSDSVLDELRDDAIGWIEWGDGSRAGWWY